MPHDRYFIDSSLTQNEEAKISGQEFNHLTRVMRKKAGDTLELINGKNTLAHGTILTLNKNDAAIKIDSSQTLPKKGPKIILAQAIPRFAHLEFILEKGTELGADAFWLFAGMRSEKVEFSDNQKARIDHILISAIKQCGRLDLPEIVSKPPLLKWQGLQGSLFYGDVKEEAPPFLKVLNEKTLLDPIIFCIGPEKGFSSEEEDALDKLNGVGVKLHENILRAETAPLAALSVIHQVLLGKKA